MGLYSTGWGKGLLVSISGPLGRGRERVAAGVIGLAGVVREGKLEAYRWV